MKKKSKIVICLDFDSTVANRKRARLEIAKFFGISLKQKEILITDMFHEAFRRGKLSEEIHHKFTGVLYDIPKFALSAQIFPGVRAALRFFQQERLPYFIITRNLNSEMVRRLLRKRKLWPRYFDNHNVFATKKGNEGKRVLVRRLKISACIDDQPSVLAELKSVKHRFLFDPYRGYTEFNKNYTKVRSWHEFLKELKKIL